MAFSATVLCFKFVQQTKSQVDKHRVVWMMKSAFIRNEYIQSSLDKSSSQERESLVQQVDKAFCNSSKAIAMHCCEWGRQIVVHLPQKAEKLELVQCT